MKLVFPGGEHPQVLLGPGVNRVGSDPHATIVLDRPGVLPEHCQLHVTPQGVMLDVPAGTAVSVNGRPVSGLIALRPGDTVAFDHVQARLVMVEPGARPAPGPRGMAVPAPANDDPGVTAVRPALPRFALRGVSGAAFGRHYPVVGSTTVGRSPECTLRLDEPGISRLHARLLPTADGLLVEDLGSTNGSFINGKRVLRGEARPGDEIGFDTLRFRVLGSGGQGEQGTTATETGPALRLPWLWGVLAAAGLLVAALVLLR